VFRARSWTLLVVVAVLAVAGTVWLVLRGRVPPPAGHSLTLRAAAMTPTGVVPDAVVSIERGIITSVRPATAADTAPAIDGVIFPGLINLHDHLTWNVLPDWTPPRTFSNRYEWQATPDYEQKLRGPYASLTDGGFGCDMNRFGEVKALIGGSTATIGGFSNTSKNACVRGLVRNLDLATELHAPGRVNREPLRNFVFPLRLTPENEAALQGMPAAILHVAEGVDRASLDEFAAVRAKGFLKPGITIVQGVALGEPEFREMKSAGVGYVWSPTTNLRLYGKTTDIRSAEKSGVTIAIAPDWSPTGSGGMLQELAAARHHNATGLAGTFSDEALVRMVTTHPARLAGIDRYVGSIEPGKLADFLVMRRRDGAPDTALVSGRPQDVLLVTIAGEPLYGDEALMRTLLPGAALERIDVCGARQALHIADSPSSRDSWSGVSARLADALRPLSLEPSALTACR
jgi:hypothetical protein